MSSSKHVEAIDFSVLHWLSDKATAAIGDVWKAAMTGLWSAAVWMLKLAFKIIDKFTTPNLLPTGPMEPVLRTTLWLGATLAVIMMFVQLALALLRRDGRSMGQVLIGIGQFAIVWGGYLGTAGVLVAAARGLEHGILSEMLQAKDLSHVNLSGTLPTRVEDITLATVLGILGLLLVIPSAFFYVLIMFVREAALIILVATAPISAAGLVSETGKVWFWKTLRWFFSCLLIAPMTALLLGIGVKLSVGVIKPPAPPKLDKGQTLGDSVNAWMSYANQNSSAHAGMAVVGCIVFAIGACCPLVMFRLLAFVEPGTSGGAGLRQSWSDAGGLGGVMSGGKKSAGSTAATQSGSDGRSGGESGAESQTQARVSRALGMFGTGMRFVTSTAHRSAEIANDVLDQAGVGTTSMGWAGVQDRTPRTSASKSGGSSGTPDLKGRSGGDGTGAPPAPPTPPLPGGPGGGVAGPSTGGAGGGGAAGGAGAAGGSEAAAAAVVAL